MMLAPAGKRKHTSILPLLAIVVLVSTSRALSILLHTGVFLPAALLGFLWLLFSLGASALHRDVKLTPQEERSLDDKRVNVVIPLKNEDPEAFRQLLESISKQSRLPQKVHVVDNGSNNDDCHRVFLTWGRNRPISIEAVYDTTGPIGKRGAQALAFDADLEADYFVTVDSDTILDVHSIARGIAPFFKPEITSVAGLLLTLNGQKNLLTRLVDLSFTTSFLNGRASWSRLGSVVVNCGGLAFYRATVVRKYQDEYVNQKVLGRRVSSGDDRMLTCYALLEGKTVIQESSIAYTLMPENISHLTRQRVRWWRSFFWGGSWLLLVFPLKKVAWWLVLWQFIAFIVFTVVVPVMLVVGGFGGAVVPFLFYMVLLSYVRSVRYLSVRRPDQTFLSQLVTFALAPVSSLFNVYLCSMLQYVGLVTCLKTGWSTRAEVEVSL